MARKRRFSGSQARQRDLDTIRELNYLLDETQVANVLSLDTAQQLEHGTLFSEAWKFLLSCERLTGGPPAAAEAICRSRARERQGAVRRVVSCQFCGKRRARDSPRIHVCRCGRASGRCCSGWTRGWDPRKSRSTWSCAAPSTVTARSSSAMCSARCGRSLKARRCGAGQQQPCGVELGVLSPARLGQSHCVAATFREGKAGGAGSLPKRAAQNSCTTRAMMRRSALLA
jgi:hypothetical protein